MSGGVQLIILENTIYISVFVVIVCVRVCVGGYVWILLWDHCNILLVFSLMSLIFGRC